MTNPTPGGQDRDRHGDRHEELADEIRRLGAFLSERGLSSGFVLNNVEIDRYDARLFTEVLAAEPELASLARRAGKDAPKTFGPLLLDLFASFYKMVPGLVDPGQVDPSHRRANRPFVERMRQDEAALLARLDTATDEVASSLATIEAARRILEELARRPALRDWLDRQADPRPDDPTEARAEPEPAPEPAPEPEEPAPERPKDRPEDAPGGSTDELPGAQTPAGVPDGESAEDTDTSDRPEEDVTGGFAQDLRALVRAASDAGAGEASSHHAALRDWGLRPADLRTVPLDERLEIARRLRTRRMRDLADLLGKMRNHRRAAERRKVKANRDEVHDVTTSGDVARVLPSERARAFGSKNPARRMDFFRRLSQRAVPSYSLRSEEPVGRGPVIAMIDSSWSMNGSPMEWASAVALALAHAATGRAGTGARRVHAIFFNARIVLEAELAPGERDVRKFLAIGTVEADGGTEYVPPLARALEILSAGVKPGEGDPDLLLVTDGICKLPEEFAARLSQEKTSRGFNLVSVLVGDHARAGSVEPFSDKVIRASELARASGARDAAGALFDGL
jgi:hypothetical protein